MCVLFLVTSPTRDVKIFFASTNQTMSCAPCHISYNELCTAHCHERQKKKKRVTPLTAGTFSPAASALGRECWAPRARQSRSHGACVSPVRACCNGKRSNKKGRVVMRTIKTRHPVALASRQRARGWRREWGGYGCRCSGSERTAARGASGALFCTGRRQEVTSLTRTLAVVVRRGRRRRRDRPGRLGALDGRGGRGSRCKGR